MLNVELDHEDGIALLEPREKLTERDFEAARQIIDPYIEEHGRLNGIIIQSKTFPGWDSFSALLRHLKFVRNHHRGISHVAVVTDSVMGGFVENVASHFVEAEVRTFPYHEFISARQWILEERSGQ